MSNPSIYDCIIPVLDHEKMKHVILHHYNKMKKYEKNNEMEYFRKQMHEFIHQINDLMNIKIKK